MLPHMHREMVLRGVSSLVLTNEVWERLGVITAGKRQAILGNLKKVPDVFELT